MTTECLIKPIKTPSEACIKDDVLDDVEEPGTAHSTSTRNACKLCTPLGACLVFRGVEGCIPFLHGSQGCSTYIRRYLISHFREPIDIASSNFHEESAIFGGASNLETGLTNVIKQYHPSVVGLATTCLAETIGEDMPKLLHDFRKKHAGEAIPPLVHVSTPSYRGTHMDGFHAAVTALVSQLAKPSPCTDRVNLFPGMVSPADLRYLKEIIAAFGLHATMVPDYSETMDGETWTHYEKLQSGGTPVADIERMSGSRASIEFGRTLESAKTAGSWLASHYQIPRHHLGLPIGIQETDAFFAALEYLSSRETPAMFAKERGRLIDSLIDGHKYVYGKRALVFGEEDMVIGLTAFLTEIGVTPVLCASGGKSGQLAKCVHEAAPGLIKETMIREGFDFVSIGEVAESLKPDFLIGSSKGYSLARKLNLPLIRVGFPIHDRLGGQRVLHLGYRGAQELFDKIVNMILERKQDSSPVGYSYI